ncbi:MAG: hypothetical protein OXP09_13000 [Gammaproteobacteria bacterium]|nr:hypothetical protein [Gammaproteobacteria bacterium]MDE0366480.1 hypothetical protein [Gammaproteobacteria bacterium]
MLDDHKLAENAQQRQLLSVARQEIERMVLAYDSGETRVPGDPP